MAESLSLKRWYAKRYFEIIWPWMWGSKSYVSMLYLDISKHKHIHRGYSWCVWTDEETNFFYDLMNKNNIKHHHKPDQDQVGTEDK